MIRRIRVRAENGPRFAEALRAAGFQAEWLGPGTAYTSFMGGCGDPGCCPQHEAYYAPQKWGAIKTNASGTQAHRVWVKSGLLQCQCRHCRGG